MVLTTVLPGTIVLNPVIPQCGYGFHVIDGTGYFCMNFTKDSKTDATHIVYIKADTIEQSFKINETHMESIGRHWFSKHGYYSECPTGIIHFRTYDSINISFLDVYLIPIEETSGSYMYFQENCAYYEHRHMFGSKTYKLSDIPMSVSMSDSMNTMINDLF